MSESLLITLYASSALIAIVVFVATLRAPGFSVFRWGLLIYLTGTAWWALMDLWRWLAGTSVIELVEAWTLPGGALVIAGVRVGVHAATRPGWRVSPLDVLAFALHPIAVVVVAVVPALRVHVASADAAGVVVYGPIFWGHVAVTYALLVAATFDLVRGGNGVRALNRRTAPVVISIWMVPLVASAVTMSHEGPNGIDLMPPGFALTALLIWRALVPADVTQLVPIARSQVFEELADAVIVVGDKDEILDANAAALRLVGAQGAAADFMGQSMRSAWPIIADAGLYAGEHDVVLPGGAAVLDVAISPLSEANGAPSGRVVVLRDVTEAVLQRRELARLRAELADLVVRDAVTGLHNRRYAEQTVPQMLARSEAKGVPFSVAILDVDHFKRVNDTHGHPVGDRVLQAIARAMLDEVPEAMLARMGGEEFLAILPGLSEAQAFAHAERLRAACADAEVATRDGVLRVTVSAGVATLASGREEADHLLERADAALYRAKREGRNRTCTASDQPEQLVTGS